MNTDHGHVGGKHWYLSNPHPVKFTEKNAVFCPECGQVLVYSFRGVSYMTADYYENLLKGIAAKEQEQRQK